MRKAVLAILLMTILVATPSLVQAKSDYSTQNGMYFVSGDAILPPKSYIWQEINGFCAWAAIAMAMQYAGIDVSLYDVFAASSIGFSFAYFHINDTILMFPGAIYSQLEPTDFIANLYGINYTLYVSSDIPYIDENIQIWESEGISVGVLDNEDAAFNLMRETIDSGYPLLISVDPTFLPASDYDILREEGISGGGHGILLVGYNDTLQSATILDPGVGSFGDDYGYPEDGRGNYTVISYYDLRRAWSPRYYIANTFIPGKTPLANPNAQLGQLIRDKLLGQGSIYSPYSANAYIGQFGQAGFRALSSDMTAEGLKTYLSIFDGIDDEVEFKASVIMFIGLALEAQVTLQYLSYRTALDALPEIMNETDLTDFTTAGERALSFFEELADNSSLINPTNLTRATGFVASTFRAIADSYNTSGDIDAAFAPYESALDDISEALLGIADSWRDAGNELAKYWPNDFLSQYGIYLAFGVGGVVILLVYFFWWNKKRPSR